MADIVYQVEKECPVCGKTFTVTKVRNRLSMIKQDTDFCAYYKEINPYYYSVWVCSHCGYAAQDAYFKELTSASADKIRGFLQNKEVNVNFGGVRTLEQAIATYKLAIFFAELTHALFSRTAGLYLKLAWLFREGDQAPDEKLALAKARDCYESALLKERMPIGNMSEVTLEYLIAELHRRTGQLDQALAYLGKLVADPQAKMEKRILEMARDAWHQARDAKKQIQDHDPGES